MSDPRAHPVAEYAALTDDDLVTGEAVALDLPTASIGSRVVSGMIDVVVTLISALGIFFLTVALASRGDDALLAVGAVSATVLVFIAIPTTVETLTRGRSLGKLAMGLRTVRDDAGPISFHHAFVRALVGYVEIYLLSGVPAFFSALLSSRGKRLGDHAAGTYVIRERIRLQLAPPAMMPPPLHAWAAGADIAPLPTALALAVRQFLGRVTQISPQARADLAARLAAQVQQHVSPPPPPGTPAEAFLAAVLVARRDRDLARLGREDELRRRLSNTALRRR